MEECNCCVSLFHPKRHGFLPHNCSLNGSKAQHVELHVLA
jgi:hypothetical protein